MAIEITQNNAVGSLPAHAVYGVPVSGNRLAQNATQGTRLAAASGPYLGRGNKCSAKDDTCEGNRVKDSEYCMGHLRAAQKVIKQFDKAIEAETKTEVTDGV
jgi:hypothetical protein